jgi:hypothetical protein
MELSAQTVQAGNIGDFEVPHAPFVRHRRIHLKSVLVDDLMDRWVEITIIHLYEQAVLQGNSQRLHGMLPHGFGPTRIVKMDGIAGSTCSNELAGDCSRNVIGRGGVLDLHDSPMVRPRRETRGGCQSFQYCFGLTQRVIGAEQHQFARLQTIQQTPAGGQHGDGVGPDRGEDSIHRHSLIELRK